MNKNFNIQTLQNEVLFKDPIYIGIDISKDKFDASFLSSTSEKNQLLSFPNSNADNQRISKKYSFYRD